MSTSVSFIRKCLGIFIYFC